MDMAVRRRKCQTLVDTYDANVPIDESVLRAQLDPLQSAWLGVMERAD